MGKPDMDAVTDVGLVDGMEFDYDGTVFSKIVEDVVVVVEESSVLPDSWVVHAESMSNGIFVVDTVSAPEVDPFVDSAIRVLSSVDERGGYVRNGVSRNDDGSRSRP